MPEAQAWAALACELEAGRPCALVVVAERRGSGPGWPGALLAVGVGGPLAGTIGGGPSEEALAAEVAAGLARGALRPRLVVQTHRPGAPTASGLACGGDQTVAVASLAPAQAAGVAEVADALAAGRRAGWTLTDGGWAPGIAGGAGFARRGDGWGFAHESGPTHAVWVVGAGHVGRALVPLLLALDFRVGVIDERPGLAATAGGHAAYDLAYERLAEVVAPGERVFVTLATHAPDRDAAALDAVAGLGFGYVGVIGSAAKVHRLLSGRGRTPSLHAPMGLPIGSRTPEEVAVSVAAELVAVRAASRCLSLV